MSKPKLQMSSILDNMSTMSSSEGLKAAFKRDSIRLMIMQAMMQYLQANFEGVDTVSTVVSAVRKDPEYTRTSVKR